MAQFWMNVTLDRDSEIPVGTQLGWRLRALIASGVLDPGDRLPPVRQLAAWFGVNVNTVRAVYARLAQERLIVSEHGRGTFVGERRGGDLGSLARHVAREARRHGVDQRDLAAILFAGVADPNPAPPLDVDADADMRRGLRAEIEALEHEMARLEPRLPDAPAEPAGSAAAGLGARLVSTRELEKTRDDLARRVADRHRRLREARAAATAKPEPERERERTSAWPELLASRPALG